MNLKYHQMARISTKETARKLVRRVLDNNQGNVRKTARILEVSRLTVRRARDGTLEDYSRRPQHIPRRIPSHLEQLIAFEGKQTGYGAQRLSGFMFRKYGYRLSMYTVYGFTFICLALLWLRGHNVRERIRIQPDNGSEFCGGSSAKLAEWNSLLALLQAHLDPIPPGAKHLQALVENSHRKDDESFLSIHPKRCGEDYAFLGKAQRWQDTWNTARPSYGIAMRGRTPLEKLRASKSMIHLRW